ncbi:rho GTPase-activating protein 22 [Pelomyxa schiedti]|nr:rho GTPase-activating protein 22 [Pelomyxa schiedti]
MSSHPVNNWTAQSSVAPPPSTVQPASSTQDPASMAISAPTSIAQIHSTASQLQLLQQLIAQQSPEQQKSLMKPPAEQTVATPKTKTGWKNKLMRPISTRLGANTSSPALVTRGFIPLFPDVVWKMCNYIKQNGLDEEGIFRVPGATIAIALIRSTFETGEELDSVPELSPNAVASALTSNLREQPEPLIPFADYPKFIAAQSSLEQTGSLVELKNAVNQLPPTNKLLLHCIVNLLVAVSQHSAENKMSSSNLGVIFGPNFLREEVENLFSGERCDVVSSLIDHYGELFDDSELTADKFQRPGPPVPTPIRVSATAKTPSQQRLDLTASAPPKKKPIVQQAPPGCAETRALIAQLEKAQTERMIIDIPKGGTVEELRNTLKKSERSLTTVIMKLVEITKEKAVLEDKLAKSRKLVTAYKAMYGPLNEDQTDPQHIARDAPPATPEEPPQPAIRPNAFDGTKEELSSALRKLNNLHSFAVKSLEPQKIKATMKQIKKIKRYAQHAQEEIKTAITNEDIAKDTVTMPSSAVHYLDEAMSQVVSGLDQISERKSTESSEQRTVWGRIGQDIVDIAATVSRTLHTLSSECAAAVSGSCAPQRGGFIPPPTQPPPPPSTSSGPKNLSPPLTPPHMAIISGPTTAPTSASTPPSPPRTHEIEALRAKTCKLQDELDVERARADDLQECQEASTRVFASLREELIKCKAQRDALQQDITKLTVSSKPLPPLPPHHGSKT